MSRGDRGRPGRTSEARIRSRILRWGLLAALLVQVGTSLGSPSVADTAQLEQGMELFQVNCSSCHGLDAEGTNDGPTLIGVGPASVDFMLTSGRMPLGDPNDQPMRQAPKFTPDEIDALVAYVASIAPGGPTIPRVDAAAGDLQDGMRLFINNCASCHGAGGTGDSVGGGQIAPDLMPADPTQIGEAIRTGPGVMPKFGPEVITDEDLGSIARYLQLLRDDEGGVARGGLQLGRVGAVVEGFVAVVLGLGILVIALRLMGARS